MTATSGMDRHNSRADARTGLHGGRKWHHGNTGTETTVITSRGNATGLITEWRGDGNVEIDLYGHRVVGELLEHWQRRQK